MIYRPDPSSARRFFYASSACIYPEHKQVDTDLSAGLKESDAWPAQVRCARARLPCAARPAAGDSCLDK